jgi:hypothetical protein
VTTRVAIDPNVRVRGNQTYAGFEDVTGPLALGTNVEVYEPETGLAGPAEVVEVDAERRLVYLAVEWAQLREPTPRGEQPPRLPVLLDLLDIAVTALQRAAEAFERSMADVHSRLRARSRPPAGRYRVTTTRRRRR